MRRNLRMSIAAVLVLLVASPARAQETQDEAPKFTTEQLEQLVATIALYPDSLVSQILMASTYPLEVVQADRWTKDKDASLTGDALAKALDEQTWDASVKSLVNFPDVLDMMSKDLDWMTKLGDAFIGQQEDVLAAVQRLRKKASDEGNLESNDQQEVIVETGATETIVIKSTSPEVIYVPTYNPVVVYGTWPYPAYPPYAYYPPGYVATTAAVSFGIGVACGAAWGYAWGGCNWRGGDIDIDINRNANFNRDVTRTREARNQIDRGGNRWNHDRDHRRGVSYRDRGTAERFGQTGPRDRSRAREQYRGRAEAGRRDLGRGDTRGARPGTDRRSSGSRAGSSNRGSGSSARGSRGGSRGSAFERSGGSRSTRSASSRGRSSRSGSAGSRSGSRSRGGGGRSGGGRSRGGGRRR